MMKLAYVLKTMIFGIILVSIGAVAAGTLIWLIWPHVIPDVFPGLVASGIFIAKLSWPNAVLLSWLIALLFRSGSSSSK